MPNAQPLKRLPLLIATLLAAMLVVTTVDVAEAAKPVKTLTWSDASCADGLISAQLTVDGKGRWATVEVEASNDGSVFLRISQTRNELGVAHGFAFSGAEVWLRARVVKRNGTPDGEWALVGPISCA